MDITATLADISLFSKQYGPILNLLSAGAVLVTAFYAGKVIKSSSKTARERATLDLVFHKESDETSRENRNAFLELCKQNEGSLLQAMMDQTTENGSIIREALNEYELISIGIQQGILDEEFYRMWFKTTFVQDWNRTRSCIAHVRDEKGVATYFEHYEKLAIKWGGKAIGS